MITHRSTPGEQPANNGILPAAGTFELMTHFCLPTEDERAGHHGAAH